MYHQRITLNNTTTDNSLTQPRTNTPLTARRVLQSSSRAFSQQQPQQHRTHNNQDDIQPYSSDRDLFSSQPYHQNPSSRMPTYDDDCIPISSPSTKRKYAESTLEYGKQMDDITNCLKTVMKQQQDIVDGMQALRKSHEKTQKITHSLLNATKLDLVSAKAPVQLPIYKYKDENLFASMSSSLSITAIHCRLVRKLYSPEEIINGVPQNEEDERFGIVKGAMIAAFFQHEPEKFERFWNNVGSKHIGGQRRAARSRSKKARPDQSQTTQITGSVMAEVNSELNSEKQFDDDDDDDDF